MDRSWILAVGVLALAGSLGATEAPAWWKAFTSAPRMESRFVQESESAVFGALRRTGVLKLAKGGRLRVEYDKGLLVVADGTTLVQYDARARTAQKVDLRGAAKEAPLLWILADPAALEQVFTIKAGKGPGAFVLEPRKPGLPSVTLEGKGNFPHRITWIDPTNAKQVLEFLDPHVPGTFGSGVFTFAAPAGTRWINN
jgi:outer membrane lipoprotein-sorting protein